MSKEYIERVALIDKMSKLKTGGIFTEVFKKVVLEIISNHPTADVQEVRHGKWIPIKGEFFSSTDGRGGNVVKCSVCGEPSSCGFSTPYCSICGAKMDKE